MDVSEDVVSTLRAEARHPPVLLDEHPAAAGFCTEHSASARGVGYGEETSPTLRAGVPLPWTTTRRIPVSGLGSRKRSRP